MVWGALSAGDSWASVFDVPLHACGRVWKVNHTGMSTLWRTTSHLCACDEQAVPVVGVGRKVRQLNCIPGGGVLNGEDALRLIIGGGHPVLVGGNGVEVCIWVSMPSWLA